jgi:cbb3-type cytochrome oxidase subunit 3|tara:strand:+ start:688 stop:1023 length:336 start_codon:yes stop_codon:yes gene_type:complete
MIFLSKPSVYNLPGTWEKQPDVIIPHLNLTPDQGFVLFFGLVVLGLVIYGIYLTFGPGKKELRDQIDEHAKMHELGIAHGHGGNKDAYEMSGKLEKNHTHENINKKTKTPN